MDKLYFFQQKMRVFHRNNTINNHQHVINKDSISNFYVLKCSWRQYGCSSTDWITEFQRLAHWCNVFFFLEKRIPFFVLLKKSTWERIIPSHKDGRSALFPRWIHFLEHFWNWYVPVSCEGSFFLSSLFHTYKWCEHKMHTCTCTCHEWSNHLFPALTVLSYTCLKKPF